MIDLVPVQSVQCFNGEKKEKTIGRLGQAFWWVRRRVKNNKRRICQTQHLKETLVFCFSAILSFQDRR